MKVKTFSNVETPDQFIIDMRSKEEKEMMRLSQSRSTFKLNTEVYQDRAELIYQQVSERGFCPSLHHLKKEQLILFTAAKSDGKFVDFIFFKDVKPYREI